MLSYFCSICRLTINLKVLAVCSVASINSQTSCAVTFKHFGIGVKWVTETTPEAFAAAIDEKTKAIFIESIANPKYHVFDIAAVAKVVESCL